MAVYANFLLTEFWRVGLFLFACLGVLLKEFQSTDMKRISTQQEILLLTGTGFSSRQSCAKDDSASNSSLSETEQLEQACWNGLLPEMLPEISQLNEVGNKLFLWDVKEGSSFLSLELEEFPAPKDKYFSIDPYSFVPEILLS